MHRWMGIDPYLNKVHTKNHSEKHVYNTESVDCTTCYIYSRVLEKTPEIFVNKMAS